MLIKNKFKYLIFMVCLFALAISANGAFAAEKLTIAHCMPDDHPYHLSCLEFGRLISEKTNGRYELIVYPQEQMGTEHQITELCSAGTLDFTCAWDGTYEQYEPKTGISRLPFLMDSWDHFWAVMDGEIGRDIIFASLLDHNLEVLPGFMNGEYSIVSRVPVQVPGDVKGRKVRIQPSAVLGIIFETLGGIATPIAFGEVYTALQLGTVDMQYQNPVNTYTSRHHEVSKYYCETNSSYFNQAMAVNINRMKSFSDEDQKAIREAAYEAALFNRNYATVRTEECRQLLMEEGMEFFEPDRELWKQALQPVYDICYEKYPEWRDIVEKIRAVEY